MHLPKCIGHRGASVAFPENTLASFEKAIQDGADGIETDIHTSSDGVIIMFHDAYLHRVTDGTGLIARQPYHQKLEQVRTKKEPKQPLCTFDEMIELLCQPANQHVLLNLDVKVDNLPEYLFPLMRKSLERVPSYETVLAPRIVLGLWHPSFLEPAKQLLPECKRMHIGTSIALARDAFWDHVDGFSIHFSILMGSEGQRLLTDATKEGKTVWVWTVNGKPEMLQAIQWGVDAVITDKPADYLSLSKRVQDGTEGFTQGPVANLGYFSLLYYWVLSRVLPPIGGFVRARRMQQARAVTDKSLSL